MPFRVTGLDALSARLAKAGPELHALIPPACVESAQIIATQAESNANSFSSKIGSQISVVATEGGAQVRVAYGEYPHRLEARVMEGDGQAPSEFAHPVFNQGGFATQMSHPFLEPALDEKREEAIAPVAAVVRHVITGG